jgi:hypothetical protein
LATQTVGVFGQSFAQALLGPVACAVMKAEYLRAGHVLNLVGYAMGGSSILKADAPATHQTYYWWDEDTNSAGPQLTAAISYINGLATKPNRFIWLQGEADSVVTSPDPTLFKSGTTSVISALKTACGTTPGVSMHVIGRRLSSSAVPGVQMIREAQLELVAAGTYVYGCDTFDLPLFGDDPIYSTDTSNSHMNTRGDALLGYRAAQRLLQSILSTPRMPPAISTLSRSGDDVVIPIVAGWAGGTFTHPVAPSHWAIRDATGVLTGTDLGFAWAGDTLTITPSRSLAASPRLLYPYGDLNTIDRVGLIYDTSGNPLRSLSAAIP